MFSKKDKNKNLGISRNSFSVSSDSSSHNIPSTSKENRPRSTALVMVTIFTGVIATFVGAVIAFLASKPVDSFQSSTIFSFQELEKNHYNELRIYSIPNLQKEDYQEIFTSLENKKTEEIIQLMTEKQEMNFISFGFYYLANTYAAAGDNEKALKYHEVAALNYLNPQSFLKLTEWNFFQTKNYALAYEYLHKSLEIKLEITMNDIVHPLTNGKEKSQYLLTELEKMAESGAFDREVIRTKLKAELPEMLIHLREMYGIPSTSETTPQVQ